MKKALAITLLISALSGGCSRDSLPLFSSSHKNREPPCLSNLLDVDGDRKPDIVFAVSDAKKIIPPGGSEVTLRRYFIFFRRNLGNGNYDSPKFLFVTDKEEAMRGIPYEDVDRESFKDAKRSEYLKKLIEQVSY